MLYVVTHFSAIGLEVKRKQNSSLENNENTSIPDFWDLLSPLPNNLVSGPISVNLYCLKHVIPQFPAEHTCFFRS